MGFEINTFLEIASVAFSLLYLVLLIKEKKVCWFFGIAGSLLSIFLFYRIHLYSESILYIYYVLIGFYGYYLWDKNEKEDNEFKISTYNISSHLVLLLVGLVGGASLGYVFETYTDADNAYLDAFTTVFSFIASYLEAKKVLSAWIFWIVLNGVTIYLYSHKALDWYAGLTVIYTVFSFVGYFKWKKVYNQYKEVSLA
jgi:nicotinamide mononucleotide transporter